MSKKSLKKDGSLYFRQTDTWRFLGAALVIVGIVWFWLGRSMASYYVPFIITPVGLIMFFVAGGRNISESDMTEARERALLDYDRAVTDMPDFDRKVLKQPADVVTEAYHMGERARYFKRGKNSSVLSDRFVRTHFFFTRDALLVCSREVSLTEMNAEEGGGCADQSETCLFTELTRAELREHITDVTMSNTKKKVSVKWCELVLTGQGGEVLCLPVNNDMDMSGLCENINRRIAGV